MNLYDLGKFFSLFFFCLHFGGSPPFGLSAPIPGAESQRLPINQKSEDLVVVSYNLWLLSDPFSLEANPHIRIPFILEFLTMMQEEENVDVFVLQEVWMQEFVDQLDHHILAQIFKYRTPVLGASNAVRFINDARNPSEQDRFWDSVSGNYRKWLPKNGGVMILSRFPIVSQHQHIYSLRGATDVFANKGCVLAQIQKGSRLFNVVGTHLQYDSEPTEHRNQERLLQLNEMRVWLNLPFSLPSEKFFGLTIPKVKTQTETVSENNLIWRDDVLSHLNIVKGSSNDNLTIISRLPVMVPTPPAKGAPLLIVGDFNFRCNDYTGIDSAAFRWAQELLGVKSYLRYHPDRAGDTEPKDSGASAASKYLAEDEPKPIAGRPNDLITHELKREDMPATFSPMLNDACSISMGYQFKDIAQQPQLQAKVAREEDLLDVILVHSKMGGEVWVEKPQGVVMYTLSTPPLARKKFVVTHREEQLALYDDIKALYENGTHPDILVFKTYKYMFLPKGHSVVHDASDHYPIKLKIHFLSD